MAETVRFQHFEVLRKEDGSLYELGRGAMGITYKAFDTNLRCHVALKVINAAYLNSDIARQRFLREARAAAALRHPNVATVFHLGSEDDNYFYAMEFVDGETVEGFMKREGAVPAPMALEIAAQVSRALGAAQKQGLVHRDIKPSNLMIVREDGGDFTVKVIDFGLAKNSGKDGEDSATLTAGGFLGTPHFASPEQLEERDIDVRSDIYSLGVTLWYMLAGKTPFSGSLAQVMSQHLHREPPFENLEGQPAAVVALLRHMMAKDPAGRPQTPVELRNEIEKCRGEAAQARVTPKAAVADNFETAVLPETSGSAVDLASGVILAERFRLLGEVTASDHGRVFRAERLEDRAAVAVLILHSGLLDSSEAFTRLEQEVEKLQKLPHPAFQKILSLENANHHTFIVLEWVEGPALLDLLRTRRALPLAEARAALTPLAEAFDALNAAGVACPDIAAHEVWLSGGNLATPKFLPLTAAGLSSFSPEATMVASSFALMKASGAFAGQPATAYVFAVASLAYEMLGGVRAGTSAGYVPIPGVTEAGNTALRRGLNPAQGFPTAKAFVEALAAGESTAPTPIPVKPAAPAPPPLPKTVAPTPGKKSPLPLILAVVGALVLLVAGVVVWQGALFFKRWQGAQHLASTEIPSPSPTPESVPTPEPSPTPDSQHAPYEQALAAADALQQQDNLPAALAAYAALARQFPSETRPPEAMEMVAAALRSRQARLSPAELATLRQPLEAAAALNVKSAQILLGEMLQQTDPADSLKWFLAAANQGQTEAMVAAGKMLASGRGADAPDLPGAVTWFTNAANSGDAEGMFALGECLFHGKGTAKDQKRAVEFLTRAAAFNNPRALNMLGDIYRRGIPDLIQADPVESRRLFTQARDLGFLDAQGNLGVLYINGEGVPKDEKMALELFRSGAEQRSPLCMYFYAMCLEGGVGGLPKNPDQAREWYLRSAQAGNKAAVDWCKKNNIPLANTP